MSDQRKDGIAWTDQTWNPLRGCQRVSEGCRHCYAETVAARFSGPGQPYEGLAARGPARWTGKVALVEEHLADPLRWTRPRRVFVNSMSDLFHTNARDEWRVNIFAVMALVPQHTFQILTKRATSMRAWISASATRRLVADTMETWRHDSDRGGAATARVRAGDMWPLPNVWLGVSVEDQETADERIPHLISTPASVRFLSYEPALGPVDFTPFFGIDLSRLPDLADDPHAAYMLGRAHAEGTGGGPLSLDWIIVGGESGPGARPFDVAWARSTIAQCKAAGVACFVKQLGALPKIEESTTDPDGRRWFQDRKGGDPSEWPADLLVREFPAVRA